MLSFCSKLYGAPAAFYIFTGVVGYTKSKGKPRYGPEFANFISEHKLGTVTEAPARVNRTNHPTHLVKVWVWSPNYRKLKAWYNKNCYKVIHNGHA